MITKNGDEIGSWKFDQAFARKLAKMIIIMSSLLVLWSTKGLKLSVNLHNQIPLSLPHYNYK